MPAAKFRRLTPEDHQRLKVYTLAGFTAAEIAHVLGCSTDQVHRSLRNLSPRIRPAQPVAITRSQYRLIQRFDASTLLLEDLATALKVDSIILALELRGRKTMSSQRMQALNACFSAQSC